METVVLKHAQGDTLEVYLHGAHVSSWKDATGKELLFVSKKAIFQAPKAIRGGVPVCFPQFGKLGPLGQHGFVRNNAFKVVERSEASVTLELEAAGEMLQGYSGPFKLRVRVVLGAGRFWQELIATNTGSTDMVFTAALHTYFRVSDIPNAKVTGLGGITYVDSLAGGQRVVQPEAPITFDREVDRIYLGTPDTIQLVDSGAGRTYTVQKAGFPDAVVWNPWINKAAGMADFGDEEYKEMVCIEPAVASSGPVTLPPGATWTGLQYISVA